MPGLINDFCLNKITLDEAHVRKKEISYLE